MELLDRLVDWVHLGQKEPRVCRVHLALWVHKAASELVELQDLQE
jgi:hypothetical protein